MPQQTYSGDGGTRKSTRLQRWVVVALMVSPIILFLSYWGRLAYQTAQKRSQAGIEQLQPSEAVAAQKPEAESANWKEVRMALDALPLPEQEERLWAFVNSAGATPEEKAEALRALGEVQLDLLYSTHQGPGKMGHLVEPGHSLAQIAQKYTSTVPAIVRANNLLGLNVQPGQHLVIPELDTMEVHVFLQGRRLVLYWQGRFLKDYSISAPSGAAGAALVGEGTVASKIALYDGKPVQIGEPEYYLGEKLVKLSWAQAELAAPADAPADPAAPASGEASRITLASKEDLEEIFPLLTSSTRVIIRD